MGIFVPKAELGTPNGLPRMPSFKVSSFAGVGKAEKALPLSKLKRKTDANSKIKVHPNEVCKYCTND